VIRKLNEWRNDHRNATLEFLDTKDQSLWRMTKRVMNSSYSVSPLVTPGGFALPDSEKAEARADKLEAQFLPVTDPSVRTVIELVEVELRSYLMTSASEPKLTNREDV
jgi:hypothetical protein